MKEKELGEFRFDKRLKCGRRAICKECEKEANRLRRESDPNYAAYQHEWYVGHKEQHAQQGTEWRRNHPKRVREIVGKCRSKNREKYNEKARNNYKTVMATKSLSHKIWASEHKNNICAISSNRRARTKSAPGGGISPEERLYILSLYDHCLACGTKEDLSLDHVVPIVKGGAHDVSNAQILCLSCNSSKGRKTIDYRPIADWT